MNDLMSLKEIFNETLFRIPDYQRGYSWSSQQLEEFWSDLLSLLPYRDHYTGMISLKKIKPKDMEKEAYKWDKEKWLIDSGFNVFEVVDGQQRLTTLIILINEIVSYCKKNNITELNNTLLSKIEEKYLFNNKPNNIIKTYNFGYKVDNPSCEYFRKIILEETPNAIVEETFYTLNLLNAKEFFRNKISNYVSKYSIEKLGEILKKITVHLKFNMYYIDDDFNVFVAFETMNNRGKRLSYLELLKNRLIYLSTLFDNDEAEKDCVRKEINDTWKTIYKYLGKNKNHPLSDDEFLQNHWMIYFGYSTRKIQGNQNISYSTFLLNKYFIQQNIDPSNMYVPDLENYVSNNDEDENEKENNNTITNENEKQINLTLNDIKNYVASLNELIPYWYSMYFPSENYSYKLKSYLFRLKLLGHVNARPLITVLLSKNNISEEEKIECLKNIERFNFMHYRFNGYLGTYNNSVFYNLARDLYYGNNNVNDVLNVVKTIEYSSDNNVINSLGIIEKFRRLFKRDGYYSWGTLKYLLYVYDISNTTTPSEQNIDPNEYFKQDPRDSYSVEHIYPQKAVDIYWTEKFNMYSEKERKILSSSLGNMLPLSKSINSTLQNYSFDKKKDRFLVGSRSERKVAEQEVWTPETILNRGIEILNFIEQEWDFNFINLAEKKKILGLDFMIDDDDYFKDLIEPVYNDKEIETNNLSFSEEQFVKLTSNTSYELMKVYNEINNYILSLDNKIKRNTSNIYISYSIDKIFADIRFQTDKILICLMSGEYNDPMNIVSEIHDVTKKNNANKITVTIDNDLDYIKDIIKQSFQKTKNI